jgi:hypothetical protein
MRDFLCSFAMMISSQLAPGILTELKSILRPGRNSNPSSARKVGPDFRLTSPAGGARREQLTDNPVFQGLRSR